MNKSITSILQIFTLVTGALIASYVQAQGTAFTYQGRLNDGGAPAQGLYDLRFALYDSPHPLGTLLAGPITNSAVDVSNGLFTTTLDFGEGVFDGNPCWLEIAVQTNGAAGPFTILTPRQAVTPTPYAIESENAATASSVSAANLTGDLSLAQLPGVILTNGASNVSISGIFSGNGAGMTNVNFPLDNDFLGLLAFGVNFIVASSPTVGNGPASVVAADVNGDGKIDLISANEKTDTLTVLTNDGYGGFVVSASPTVGNGAASVVAADVNGDGKIDLISANENADTLTVLTNDGYGGFVVSASPTVGNAPASVVAADVNGDGKLDLISANAIDSTLTVLTNDGHGGFVVSASPAVGGEPLSVAAADVNGDGKIDLISANESDNTLTVLTNDGHGGFVVSSSPRVGNTPTSVVAADVNGDGKIDLISANLLANTVTVLTNDGYGSFVVSSSPNVGSAPVLVVAADVNGDGKIDLVSANFGGNTLTVLTNDGHGGFVVSASPGVGAEPNSVAAADVNGDGKIDLISANDETNTLTVLFNTPIFSGNGSEMTGLTASQITSGTFSTAQIPALNASQIKSGTLAEALLPTNVAWLNARQTFTSTNIFNGNVGINTSLILEGSLMINTNTYINAHPIYLRGGDEGAVDHHHGLAYTGGAFTNFGGGSYQVDGPALWGNAGGVLGTRNGTTDHGALVWSTTSVTVNGTFNNNSDRNAKEAFSPITPAQILEKVTQMPVSEWSYKVDANTRHIGPMAQDFYTAFNVGTDDKHIAPVDEGGVALAAIQGLNQKVEDREAKIQEQAAEIDALKVRLEKLEQWMDQKPR